MRIFPVLLILAALSAKGCQDNHLISDRNYRQTVESAFNDRKQLASRRSADLFSVFNRKLTPEQTEALKFLYAFMPLNDLADNKGDYFLACADAALRTRREMPWGPSVPDDIFLHYVLPYRVNNEDPDNFRILYYDEIASRIKGLGIADAALEINHWCHEKVTYQPSDIRTSGPMATILSARGRCGEESTFTVNALRTAGIPARQVYTPRWAHTDDNHAWVEVWIDGKWHYMGACEPEPFLDRGWFTEPARRAMLIHTKSFGSSYGSENAIVRMKNFTLVNNLSNYAVTKRIYVKVYDRQGIPVQDAQVEYQLYNYAEFYPLATVPTDEKGISSFETGMGDLLVWARKGDEFNFKKMPVSTTDTLALTLDRAASGEYSEDLDINVPVAPDSFPTLPAEQVKANSARLAREDLIRRAYTDSWIIPDSIEELAEALNLDRDKTVKLVTAGMGNYRELINFLSDTPENKRGLALSLLGVISEKDLRDVKASVLNDHLENVRIPEDLQADRSLFVDYVLNPRVANEMLTPWRSYFSEALPEGLKQDAARDPLAIVAYINNTIRLADDENYYGTPLTPVGVDRLKVADSWSRAIYFTAICRSLGIASGLEPTGNVPQYNLNGTWYDVYFAGQKKPSGSKGFVKLVFRGGDPVPEYYINFTLARFEKGRYNTLSYDYNKRITDFNEELQLIPGHYMIVTGNRLASGNVLASLSFFDLAPGAHISREIRLRTVE